VRECQKKAPGGVKGIVSPVCRDFLPLLGEESLAILLGEKKLRCGEKKPPRRRKIS